jgi:hypothetical protein
MHVGVDEAGKKAFVTEIADEIAIGHEVIAALAPDHSFDYIINDQDGRRAEAVGQNDAG